MKTLITTLLAMGLATGLAMADNVSIDSDDNLIYNLNMSEDTMARLKKTAEERNIPLEQVIDEAIRKALGERS